MKKVMGVIHESRKFDISSKMPSLFDILTLESLINDPGTFIFLGTFSAQDTLIRDRTFNFFWIFSAQDYYEGPYLLLEA